MLSAVHERDSSHDSLQLMGQAFCTEVSIAVCLARHTRHAIMDFNLDLNSGGADGFIDFQDQTTGNWIVACCLLCT